MALDRKIAESISLLGKKYSGLRTRWVNVGVNNDPEIATYATYQEYGWVQSVTPKQGRYLRSVLGGAGPRTGASLVMPPRPTFRATASAEAKNWKDLAARAIKRFGPEHMDQVLALVGKRAAEDIKQTIAAGGTKNESFARRAPMTMEMMRAKANGHKKDGTGNISTDKPLVLTGAFLNSIGYELE